MKSQLHYLSASHCAAPVTVGSELPGVRPVHHRLHPNLPHGEGKKPKRCPYSNLLQGTERNHNPLKHSENEFSPLGGWLGRGLQSAVFLPPKADFFYGHRPLFEPCRLLSSCKAWRWGWRRRQGGKLVFRLPSPTATKRRSRQQPPWLFVFISTPNRSSY